MKKRERLSRKRSEALRKRNSLNASASLKADDSLGDDGDDSQRENDEVEANAVEDKVDPETQAS